MKKIEINFNTILIIGALIFFYLFTRKPGGGASGSGRDTLINNIAIKFDSLQRSFDGKAPIIHNHYSIDIDPSQIPAGIDSAAIAEDYFKKNIDSDTYRDSLLEATIQDTIFQNKRIGRGFSYKILRPQSFQQSTTVSDLKHVKFFLGAFAGDNQDQKISFGISSSLIDRRENIYSIDYDLVNKFPEGFRLRFQKLISFRNMKPP